MAEGGDHPEQHPNLPCLGKEESSDESASHQNEFPNNPLRQPGIDVPSNRGLSESPPDASSARDSAGAQALSQPEPRRHSGEPVGAGNINLVSMRPEPPVERTLEVALSSDLSWMAQFNVQVHPVPDHHRSRAFTPRRRHRSAEVGPRVHLLRGNCEERSNSAVRPDTSRQEPDNPQQDLESEESIGQESLHLSLKVDSSTQTNDDKQ